MSPESSVNVKPVGVVVATLPSRRMRRLAGTAVVGGAVVTSFALRGLVCWRNSTQLQAPSRSGSAIGLADFPASLCAFSHFFGNFLTRLWPSRACCWAPAAGRAIVRASSAAQAATTRRRAALVGRDWLVVVRSFGGKHVSRP